MHEESIAIPQVNVSRYNQETGCIEIQWEHPQQCIWADILSNVSSPNSTMQSSEYTTGNYVACSDEIKANDVYIFKIVPFNKFQVGKPAIVSITIVESELVHIVEIRSCVPRLNSSSVFLIHTTKENLLL